ncbi:MAG: hypothetical protein JWO49_2678 [Arthrobacter sp.]|nr:hypothetical protein [Arthrobacter sp.]
MPGPTGQHTPILHQKLGGSENSNGEGTLAGHPGRPAHPTSRTRRNNTMNAIATATTKDTGEVILDAPCWGITT